MTTTTLVAAVRRTRIGGRAVAPRRTSRPGRLVVARGQPV